MTIKFEHKLFKVETSGCIMHGVIVGKLEVADYDLFVPEAERLINEFGKIRVFVELVDFKGWSAGALWEECKLAYYHLKDIDRMAMVGDKAWEKGLTLFMKPFVGAKLRYFDVSQKDEAIAWIEEGVFGKAAA